MCRQSFRLQPVTFFHINWFEVCANLFIIINFRNLTASYLIHIHPDRYNYKLPISLHHIEYQQIHIHQSRHRFYLIGSKFQPFFEDFFNSLRLIPFLFVILEMLHLRNSLPVIIFVFFSTIAYATKANDFSVRIKQDFFLEKARDHSLPPCRKAHIL